MTNVYDQQSTHPFMHMAVMSGTNRLLDLVLFYVDSGIHVIIRPLRIRSLFV